MKVETKKAVQPGVAKKEVRQEEGSSLEEVR